MASVPLYCEVCNKEFSGAVPAQQHFSGASHMKKINNLKCRGHKPFCKICNISCDTSLQLSQHEQSPQHQAHARKRSMFTEGQADSWAGPTTANKLHDRQYKEYDFDGHHGICYLCEIDLTSRAHAKDHLNGERHRRKLKLHKNQKPLSCNACGVTFSGPECATQHFSSEKHKKKCGLTFTGQETASAHFDSERHFRISSKAGESKVTNLDCQSEGSLKMPSVNQPAFPDYVSLSEMMQLNSLRLNEALSSSLTNNINIRTLPPTQVSDGYSTETLVKRPLDSYPGNNTDQMLTSQTSSLDVSDQQHGIRTDVTDHHQTNTDHHQTNTDHHQTNTDVGEPTSTNQPVTFVWNNLGIKNCDTPAHEHEQSSQAFNKSPVSLFDMARPGQQPLNQSELRSDVDFRFDSSSGRGFCYLCKIDLTSSQHCDQHIKGGKHLKAHLLWRQLKQTVAGATYVCKVCLMSFTGPDSQAQHFQSEKHKKKMNGSDHVLHASTSDPLASTTVLSPTISPVPERTVALDNPQTCTLPLDVIEDTGVSQQDSKCYSSPQTSTTENSRQVVPNKDIETAGPDCNTNCNTWPGQLITSSKQLYVRDDVSTMNQSRVNEDINTYTPSEGSLLPEQSSCRLSMAEVLSQSDPVQNKEQKTRPVIDVEITTDCPITKPLRMASVTDIGHRPEGGSGSTRRSQGTDLAWETRNRSRQSLSPCQKDCASNMNSSITTTKGESVRISSSPGVPYGDNTRLSQSQSGLAACFLNKENNASSLFSRVDSPVSVRTSNIYKYYCHTCKSYMNTKESVESHNRGKRHLAKVMTEAAPERHHLSARDLDTENLLPPDTTTSPRNYQNELYMKSAKEDRLCFLPTGTGKTLVSVMLMSLMLQKQPSKQVLFLVDKVLLVMQQGRYIQHELANKVYNRFDTDTESCTELMDRRLRIAMLCGGQQSTESVPLWKHDIIVVTAAFCDNLLQQKILRWTDFSLVVFDEAHHCEKNHPFNRLLKGYHLVLQSADRPQTLALTASPAGKATVPLTLAMLRELTSNLGGVSMAIVQKHEATLREFQSNSEIIVLPRPDKEQTRAVFILEMQVYLIHCYNSLLKHSNISAYTGNDLRNIAEIMPEIRKVAPEFIEKNLEMIQCGLEMCKCQQTDVADRVVFSALQNHIRSTCMVYNSLLEGGIPCAVEGFIEMENEQTDSFETARRAGLPCAPLVNLLNLHKASCTSASKAGQVSQVQVLIEQLTNPTYIDWKQNCQPMALVLVKERATAFKLTTILNQPGVFGCHQIKVTCVVGHGGGSGEMGMRVNQQRQLLEEINQYKYQVIVATSVAEEGVDWPQCELVISMYPPSTVTSLVQMRGRARKKNSKFIVLCDDPGQVDKLHDIMKRETIMMTASKISLIKAGMAERCLDSKANPRIPGTSAGELGTKDKTNLHGDDDEDRPYTVDELLEIITAPCGGMTMLPSDPYNEVYTNVYIGEESIAKSRVGLKCLGITHIVNTAEGKDDGYHVHTNHVMYRKVDITYLGIEATDMMSFNLAKYFHKCADFIDTALQNGGRVMVNCKQGASRSATIVLAFLMIKRHMIVDQAVRLVRVRREICPNDGFLQQLSDLNTTLRQAGHFNTTDNTDTATTKK